MRRLLVIGVALWSLVVPASAAPAVGPPAAPSDLTGAYTPGDGQIWLLWTDNADNESGFVVVRSTADCEACYVEAVPAETTSWADNAAYVDTTYTYYVQAFNDEGYSAPSNEVVITPSLDPPPPPPPAPVPAAPSNLSATAAGTQIDLRWTDNASDEAGFKVERCAGDACFDYLEIAEIGADATTYSDTGLIPNTTYRYRVRAFSDAGSSLYSNEAEATTPPPPPPPIPIAPTNLTITEVSKVTVSLSWSDNAGGEDGFNVYRCAGAMCTPTSLIATVGPNVQTFTDTGLARRTTYRYHVTAFNAGGESAPSNQVTAKTR
jgi:hypothetical protein